MLRRWTTLAVLGFATAATAHDAAQQAVAALERVSFETAVGRATEKNPTVAQSAQAILRAEGLLRQAKNVFQPSLVAGYGTTVLDDARGFNGLVTQPRTQSSFRATLTYPVLAASRWAAKTHADDQLRIARIGAEEARREVAIAAAQSYLAVIAAQRQLAVAERVWETSKALEEYAAQRLAAGMGSKLNALRSSQEHAASEVNVEAARLALRRSQEALGVLLFGERPVDAEGEPAFGAPPADGDESWLDRRADLRRLAAQVDAAERVLSDTWKDWLPEGFFTFEPEYVTPPGAFNPAKTWRAAVALSVPLYDGSRGGTRRIREAARNTARIQLEAARLLARSEKRISEEAVASTQRAADAASRAAHDAAEVVRITDVAFRAGATTNIEVVQAQQTARNAEIAAAVAEDRVRQAKLDLLVALGLFPQPDGRLESAR